jgi:DMSO reductase family type II enzyme chaperone
MGGPTEAKSESRRGVTSSNPRGEAARAGARSRVYQLLARAFAYPDARFYDDLRKGRWRDEIERALPQLPFDLSSPGGVPGEFAVSCDDLQTEYVRLFEAGVIGGAPCSLFAGHHESDRLRVMEELIRFYNYFGLRLAEGQLPDHITVELEFMHYLGSMEAESLSNQGDHESYRRAQNDFLERQLARWLPVLRKKLQRQGPLPFFAELVALADEFVRGDRDYLKQRLRGTAP